MLSADSIAALSACVNLTVSDARVFHSVLEIRFVAPGYPTSSLTTSEIEFAFGRTVRRLATDLKSLKGVELPAQIELGVNTLRPMFFALIERLEVGSA